MSEACSLKIDIFTHILPINYKKALDDNFPGHLQQATNAAAPTLWDLDHRFRLMEKYGVMHVITLCRPPIEEITNDHKKALDLTRAANDEMAEL
ncbi:MAG: amidohydrolase, partial [Dehalococcoidia bacterium]